MTKIFAYGTLKSKGTRSTVLHRIVPAVNATLYNYEVLAFAVEIEGSKYPNIRPVKNRDVQGKVFDVTDKELAILDEWETDAYERIFVTVSLIGNTVKAQMYIQKEV